MEDETIIDLYFAREERAISETGKKYGGYCRSIAFNILHSHEDTEECVSDTYLHTWNTIPPTRPGCLRAFLGRITRNLSFTRWEAARAQKRGGKGVICHRVSEKTGKLTGIAMVAPDDDIMLLSDSGVIIRTKVADIPVYGRSAGGVIVMRLTDGASLVSFAAVSPEDEESYGAESAVEPEETVESELPPEGEA